MSATVELMQPELFGQDEPQCPGYDVCPISMCGCRFLGLGTPFASDVKKGTIYADTALHGNDYGLLLTHRKAITQTGMSRGITMNYQTVIQFLSAKKDEVSSYAAELSSMGFKDEAAALWAEEDELVKRIGVLLDKDQEQNASTLDMSMFENIDGLE